MPVVISDPSDAAAVSLDEVKKFLRVKGQAEDVLINGLISACTKMVELEIGRSLITRTLVDRRRCFPACRIIELEFPPLISVTSITYLDGAGSSQTLSSSKYSVDTSSSPGRIELNKGETWPTTYDKINAVTITYTAGYGAASKNVEPALKLGILNLIEHYYANRSPVNVGPGLVAAEIPGHIARIIKPFKVY